MTNDGLTRRDCIHAFFIDGRGRGVVCCDRKDCQSLTGGMCVGRKLCKHFRSVKDARK